MNGGDKKIEILKPFEEAFEVAKKILFRPFELKKWCVIGFAAFLSGHFSAGGFNLPIGNLNPRQQPQTITPPNLEQWKAWLPLTVVAFVVGILIFILVMMWLRARGTFIFTDCIVRNRAAIAEPWREYRREGNSYFLFSLLVGFGVMIAFLIIAAPVFFFLTVGQREGGAWLIISIATVAFFAICFLAAMFLVNVVAYFMSPVMYVRRCRAVDAFREVLGLVLDNPVPFILFCLFGFCLLLGMVMIGGVVTCLTCCLAALPYVGTVIMLPVFVFLRAFGLLFIRQFGPDYDVWTVNPETPVAAPPTPPPLQA